MRLLKFDKDAFTPANMLKAVGVVVVAYALTEVLSRFM